MIIAVFFSPSESKQYLPEVGDSIRFTVGSGRTRREPSSLALFEVLPSQPGKQQNHKHKQRKKHKHKNKHIT